MLDVTGPDYEYNVAELSDDGGKLAVDYFDHADRIGHVDQVGCLGTFYEYPRACYYDGAALDGNVLGVNPSITGVGGVSPGDEFPPATSHQYAVIGEEVYYRSTTFVAANESAGLMVELGVERVDAATMLEDVAPGREYVSDAAKAIVRNETTRTNEPLDDANEVIVVDGGYYVVYEDYPTVSYSADPAVERGLEAASLVAGVFLLLRL